MQDKLIDSGKIKQNGWKQGACLNINSQQVVYICSLSEKEQLPAGLYIILSQDCDVLQRSLL